MSEPVSASPPGKGWWVVFSGLALNLALGVLYAWSVFAKQLTETVERGGFGWSKTAAAVPYTTAIGVFALMMVPAGRLQDRLGPRAVATTGAILTSAGLLVAGFAAPDRLLPVLVGFGLMGGAGIGLGYAAATPAAVKWFPPHRKGLVTGIVVSGFGLAPVYIAPFSRWLLSSFGVADSFRILGLCFAAFAVLAARGIVNPPVPAATGAAKAASRHDYTWDEMVRTPTFWLLWVEYACAATAGLMIIGHLARIVAVQSGNRVQTGFLFVALLAVFNATGRLAAGFVSDRIGRLRTILIVCLIQAAALFGFSALCTSAAFCLGSAAVGFCYGACLALFPSTTADFWGTRNLGLNYGLVFTAWGVGGVFGPLLAGKVADATGSYQQAFLIAAALLVVAALLTLVTRPPK
jgi:MFS family permease